MKKLPSIQRPTYRGKIPSSGKSFEFQPFHVKEQKVLLMALESGSTEQTYLAFRDIINECVITPPEKLLPVSIVKKHQSTGEQTSLGLEHLASFDLESIFLQISAKSVGEISKVNLECSKCSSPNLLDLNLNDVVLKNKQKADKEGSEKILLTDSIGVVMKYPSLKSFFDKGDDDEQTDDEQTDDDTENNLIQKTIKTSIECVFDETDVYPIEEVTDKDLEAFLDSLSISQMKKIESFFETVPYLGMDVSFECSNCGHKNETEIKGLKSFF